MSTNSKIVEHMDRKCWYLDRKLHREDGPAIEYTNGDKCWFIEGNRHRVDGPAVERFNGTKQWFLQGKLHREDGPAIEYVYGIKEWYYKGKQIDCYSTEEFIRLIRLRAFW